MLRYSLLLMPTVIQLPAVSHAPPAPCLCLYHVMLCSHVIVVYTCC
jgi:hypothetical protein